VFSRIGGHVALDLVNTVQWRLSAVRFEEDLLGYEHVARWASQTDLIRHDDADVLTALASRHPEQADDEVRRARALREALYRALFEQADATDVVTEYRDALSHADLVDEGDGWHWRFPRDLALPRRRIALEAMDLLTHADLDLLAQCDDAECGWVFLDTSPRHNRRWCVSADCGNRNRVREFYGRSRASAGTSQPLEG
jgi:predicted RNA-binding Zn ribbon-like protein